MAPVFLFLVVAAVIAGAVTGRMEGVTTASLTQARSAVEIAIGLVGVMAFWLGLVEVIRRGGLLDALARGLTPVFRRLFPDVPALAKAPCLPRPQPRWLRPCEVSSW